MNEGESLGKPVAADDDLPVETLKAAFSGDTPLDPDVRKRYGTQLLLHALRSRDTEAGNLIARAMDADPKLDEALDFVLNDTVHQQPDAVYAFVRAYLASNFNPRWLPRLKIAAMYSLRVAINDTAPETIINWLTLISREPQNYDLNDVLHYGILASQSRAQHEPELARQLLTLSARRDPSSLDTLLNDDALLKVLPENIGQVVRDYTGDALSLLQNRGLEIFLVALARAIQKESGALFTPAVIQALWEIYSSGQPVAPGLPELYLPEAVIHNLVLKGPRFLSQDALVALAALMIESQRYEWVFALFEQEAGRTVLLPILLDLLEQNGRAIADRLALVARLVNAGYLPPQEAADYYVSILGKPNAPEDVPPLIQQLARTLQQNTAVDIPTETLWHVLDLAAETRDEMVARAVVKRLLVKTKTVEDDTELVEMLRRMCGQTQWSESLRNLVTIWWREFILALSVVRLGRLDRALEGKKGLETERGILQTLSAIRKVIGQRSLEEFAQDVRAAYAVLEALAESFDTSARRVVNFDAPIARAELDQHGGQISPQERQLLANNLKELAQIIAVMGDSRTRANLMRRGEDLDRDLMSGEQTPHSAIDTMKWLSGYWGGTQSGQKNGDT